ncbi:hypothetical protein B0F90DRAFT_1651679 [Multifurca ochricompacta]|uniref:UBX domain-containing protein n=1 Tax=Multifurca ochricompacta TaxID=376703 RepID=A0AAD4LUM1_9AGAM|nr:hypothetical protein B0F90DRAFT_1651679 [Multifurca ochricompacta]
MLSSILTFPFHVLASIIRFIFHTLRIPIPHVPFSSLNFYRPLIPRPSSRSDPYAVSDRWIRSLEEETGAHCLSRASLVPHAGPSTPQSQNSNLRSRVSTGSPRLLPDFTLGSYDEILRLCQSDIRIGCVILVSSEHDDVPDFKRNTLTDPTLVDLLHKHEFIVWGGDVREREAWSAAQKLQATTFPFVAFIALQPPRASSFIGPTSRTSSSPSLTILSRHQGPAAPTSAPTSARSLVDHIVHQLLPRVMPFLRSLRLAATERAHERALREEQDAAFRESARRDREKEALRAEEARRTAELEKVEMEHRRAVDEARARIAYARGRWQQESRQLLIPLDQSPDADSIRMTIRLPDGQRLVRLIARNSTVTSLYCLVDAHFTPTNSIDTEINPSVAESNLRELIHSSGQPAETWWGFSLFTAYPRQAIPWRPAVRLVDIEGLRNSGQIVVEMVSKKVEGEKDDQDDDGYDTERSV